MRWPDVEPTNKLAERERKGSFGCQSARGERFVARMLAVVRTLRRQGRGVLDFLEATARAALVAGISPRLLMPALGSRGI